MKRHVLNLLTALSLLLCVAACVLWVRSYRVHSVIVWTEHTRAGSVWRRVHSTHGGLSYEWLQFVDKPAKPPGPKVEHTGPDYEESPADVSRYAFGNWTLRRYLLGFALHRYPGGNSYGSFDTYHWEVIVPYWLVVAVTAVPAVRLTGRLRRRRRARAGHCPSCDYDLRATPDRCPECGTAKA
jgi:hypothetical protein